MLSHAPRVIFKLFRRKGKLPKRVSVTCSTRDKSESRAEPNVRFVQHSLQILREFAHYLVGKMNYSNLFESLTLDDFCPQIC
jgi:hypothetical protein